MSVTRSPSGSPPAPRHARPKSASRFVWLLWRLLPLGALLAVVTALIVALGVAQRWGWLTPPQNGSSKDGTGVVFTCSMHPQIRQPGPGRCPICGMALVPASTASGADLNELSVTIEPAQRRLANIETAKVASGPLTASLQTIGAIAIDESRQATIASYIDGRLERLFADYTGVDIATGDHLAVIYSPQLYAAQVEYVEARRALAISGTLPAVRRAQESLAASTRQRLREFGMTDEQIVQLEQTAKPQSRLTIYAPQGGTVIEKLAVEGNYVQAGDPIYRIAELSTVWLMLQLFPEDASRIRFGQRVQAVVQSRPEDKLVGRVAFIDPTVDPETRTVGVRVELLNEERRLRPGDYAQAQIDLPIGPQGQVYDADLAAKWISPMHPQIIRDEPGQCPICGMDLVPTSKYGFAEKPVPQPQSLHVPRAAVLLAGGSSVVYVETEPGRFEIRPVKVGPILRDKIVILEGLKADESVATAGNFLIDSQMQLAGKPSLIDVTRAIDKKQELKGPLTFANIVVKPVSGSAGQKLEALYAAYFQVQQALAGDKKPAASAAAALNRTASELAGDSDLPESIRNRLEDIAAKSEHLHHLDLDAARKNFKPISHAVIALATQVRGEQAQTSFTHFYCPMVKGGGGDWLQSGGELLNPYYGSEMLHCGEKVRQLPTQGAEPRSGGKGSDRRDAPLKEQDA